MINKSGYFEGRENKKLFYQYWLPDSENVKINLIAIHGWGTHSDRMKIPAEFFTEKGYAIYAFDLRGHWRNAEIQGHIDSMDHIQKDIVLFMDLVKKEANNNEVFLMGHAFGGLISLIYAINHPGLQGLIVSSPQLGLAIGKMAKKMKGAISKLSPTKTISMIIDQNQLTSDLKILRQNIADKKKLEVITVKSASEMENSMKWAMENATSLICPVLILQAGNDNIVDKNKTREFFKKVKSQDKTYREYDGFLHDLWTEKSRALVYRDMYVWIEKHI
ncbi:MAG: alpha/beta hydrolase [Candidatus Odinarchaeota archaeon]